jgi:hypothetical protein
MNDFEIKRKLEVVEKIDQDFFKMDCIPIRYCINHKGLIWDSKKKNFIYPRLEMGQLRVSLYMLNKQVKFNLAKLYLMAFSPMHTALEVYVNKLSVVAFDKDQFNLSTKNIFWRIPQEGVQCLNYPAHFSIPGNPNVAINRAGEVIRIKDGVSLKITFQKEAYPRVSNSNLYEFELPYSTTTLHRLVCLAFHPIFDDPKKMFVNHKDGNKENFSIDNLEWVTYSENAVHAISTGLRGDNVNVVGINLLTKEKRNFYSLQQAARVTGIHAWEISKSIKLHKETGAISTKPWLFLDSDAIIPRLNKSLLNSAVTKNYTYFKVRNLVTAQEQYIKGSRRLRRYIRKENIEKAFIDKPWVVKGFEVSTVEAYEVPVDVKKSYHCKMKGGKIQKPISVTDLSNGTVITYPSTDAFATLVGAERKTIQRRMLFNNGVWRNFKIEYMK